MKKDYYKSYLEATEPMFIQPSKWMCESGGEKRVLMTDDRRVWGVFACRGNGPC